jgi:hypothetical protein
MAGEKDEKFDEKSMEKQDEKSTDEKGWEEKWSRDPLGSFTWALIFIWAGVVLLANNLGWLDSIVIRGTDFTGIEYLDQAIDAWSIILIGAGVILLLQVLVRLLVPQYRRPVTGTIIFAIILIGFGLGDLVNWSWTLIIAIVFIVIGISIIVRGLTRSK